MLVKAMVILLGYVIGLGGGIFFVKAVCGLIELPHVTADRGLRRAGLLLGIFERFIVLTCVLKGEYGALALVFGAKSIARFEDLKKREFSEYYLVGTLSSFSFALLSGEVLLYFLKKL